MNEALVIAPGFNMANISIKAMNAQNLVFSVNFLFFRKFINLEI